MRFVLAVFICIQHCLFAIETDFDVALVGTSPVSMLEAIYHIACNERVLILEAEEGCGGAWKSIDICGITHADLGCHLIGADKRVKEFLKTYFGCKFVCLSHPHQEADEGHQRCSNGFYFSKGCYELISCLKSRIEASPNALLLNKRLQSIYIDNERNCIELNVGEARYLTAKLIITQSSCFRVDNPAFANAEFAKHPYPHIYMLVQDPAPSCFTYLHGVTVGMQRAMNLTPFLHLPQNDLQLIAVQTIGKADPSEAQRFLEAFKSQSLLSQDARLIETAMYVYDQSFMKVVQVQMLNRSLIEILESSSFAAMAKYIEKWKTALTPIQ